MNNRQEARKLTPADLRFDDSASTAVISGAQKFILPIPNFGPDGELLVYPRGHERAGRPITDHQGQPIGERGVIFFNAKDQSWQAVPGDGQGVIIINEVTQEQAAQLDRKVRDFQDNPNRLTPQQLTQVLDYARDQLGRGDMYNSTRSSVNSKMSRVAADEVGKKVEAYGLMKRNDRDICHAVYVPGEFTFEGPAATPQMFEDGGVIIEQGGEVRGVQPEVFMRTYKLPDGSPITSVESDLKAQGG